MSCGRKEIVATMTLAFDLSIWMELCGYLLRWGPKGQGQVHGGAGNSDSRTLSGTSEVPAAV